jgi:hypothetical protein
VVNYSGTSDTNAVWGQITGTLSNQTDLQNALNAKFDDPTGTTAQYLRGDGSLATFPTIPSGTVTSVGLSMPSAFAVANSPVTSSGTLAVTGAGTADQYVRGDGQLANFPTNGGGGSSVNYYLNGSVSQGTFGGDTYYEMSKTPIIGAGTNFTRTNAQGNGYIASFITDAGDPALLNIPGGNWNVEFYFQASSSGSTPSFYAELYKVSSSNVFTLIGSGSTNPEGITQGTVVDQYFTSIPVTQTALLATDRIAIRIFVTPSGRTITLHTENSNLCEVLTTFSTGLNALNGLTAQVQYFATGTSGTDFAISSATDTHTFNLPTASGTNRGALSSADWTTFSGKVGGSGATGQVAYWNGTNSQTGSATLTYSPTSALLVNNSVTAATAIARGTNLTPTLTASANSDVLVGLDVNPAFTNGAFTGVSNHAIRVPSFNTTSSQIRIGSLELQSYSLNNSWLSDNMFFNGTGFQYRNTGKATLFYFFGGEGQFRSYASASAGTVVSTFNSCKLKFDELGNFAVGSSIGEANGLFTNAFLRVFSTGNVTINQPTTDAGYRLDVNGTARVSGNLRFDEQLRDNRDNGVILQSLSSVVTNRILTIGNATYLNINFPNGNILVGTTTNVASSKVTIDSTTQGFLPPRMTTTQKNAIGTPAAGLMVFDTTLVKLCVYNGTTWETITSI